SPTSLSYGLVQVGTGVDRNFAINNVSTDAGQILQVSSIAAGDPEFTIVSPGLPFNVAPGAFVTVTVRFVPTSTGVKSTTVTVNSNDPVNPIVSVAASGTGAVPLAALSPTSLPYGEVHTETSADRVIQL